MAEDSRLLEHRGVEMGLSYFVSYGVRRGGGMLDGGRLVSKVSICFKRYSWVWK